MTILAIEGFDHYTDGATGYNELKEVNTYSTNYTDYGSIDSTNTPFSYGKSFSSLYYRNLDITVPVSDSEVYIGFHFRIEDAAENNIIVQVIGAGGVQSFLYVTVENTIQVWRTNLLLATSTKTIVPNNWYWIEVYFKIAEEPDGIVQVKIDGEDWFGASGVTNVDTLSYTTAPIISRISFRTSNVNRTCWYDDIVIQDSAGTFLGPSRVETFMPTGDIGTPDWSNSTATGTNASHIDEIPWDDDDYVYSNTSDDIDLYSVETISASDTVHAVGVQYRAKKGATTGVIAIQSRSYDGTTTPVSEGSNGGAQNYLSSGWVGYNDVFETTNNEDTDDTAWTKTLFDDAQFGLKVL